MDAMVNTTESTAENSPTISILLDTLAFTLSISLEARSAILLFDDKKSARNRAVSISARSYGYSGEAG